MGFYYIYDNDFFGTKQLVRDIKKEVYLPPSSVFTKTNAENNFAEITTDFVPDSKQEILNIYYTVLNAGWNSFTFYCNYDACLSDVNDISSNTVLLSNLNNFVSPYNQYSTLSTYSNPLLNEKVNISITRTYDEAMVEALESKVDEIYNSLNISSYSIRDQIRTIHDYIINHTKYDTNKIDNVEDTTYKSDIAYGPLFEGYGICSGYTDAMALFLDKLNIPNFKVASESHIWNLVYLDNEWYHLDLTWDDPYSAAGADTINHNFFLISYETLVQWNTGKHNFDQSIYTEAL
jgi:transglutaminase/protease-like cytokinesis protein 3